LSGLVYYEQILMRGAMTQAMFVLAML